MSYAGIPIDRRFDSIEKREKATIYLLNCLRYRVKIALNEFSTVNTADIGQNARLVQSSRTKESTSAPKQVVKTRISLYNSLIDLLEEFDASGWAEIFRLLLERRSPIPLFLPNGHHHLPMLRLLNKAISNRKIICIGQDIDLLRLTVISCRKKEDSKTAELVKEVFHLDSLHREDFSMGCFTREFSTAEIGLGCLLPVFHKMKKRNLSTCCCSTLSETLIPCGIW